MSTSARRSKAPPVTAANHRLSIKHLRESIAFNDSHAAEHAKAKKDDVKALKKVQKSAAKARK